MASLYWIAVLLVILFWTATTSVQAAEQCIPADGIALLKLKSQVTDLAAIWNSNDTNCCNWYGVECNVTTGRVHYLYLPSGSAETPTSVLGALATMSELKTLNAIGRPFTGPIPTSLSNLTKLKNLWLPNNPGINGTLPHFLFSLPNLEELDLSCDYSFSGITGSLPSNFSKLSKLRILKLKKAKLVGTIPSALSMLHNLESLDLSNNLLHGTIPSAVGLLHNLQDLDLSNNFLHGPIPASLGDLSKLQYLSLQDNPDIGGTLPSSFEGLNALSRFRISNTGLYGPIPDIFRGTPNLQVLEIQNNYFTGPLPPSLSLLGKLSEFDGHSNYLSGPLSDGFGSNLTNLYYLDLSYNKINGLPTDLKSIKNLFTLKLSGNVLTFDSIKGITSIPTLSVIKLSNCSLKGPIPSWFSKLRLPGDPDDPNLPAVIDLSFNSITGSISPEFGNIIGLGGLYLHNNKISGIIPSNLGNAISLEYVDLSENQLSGSIPESLSKLWRYIKSLDLSHNKISGIIPSNLGNAKTLQNVDLSENQLSGSIPESLSKLWQLNSLDLSHNKISGSIPESFLNLGLESLDLSYNKLSGKIPQGDALTKFNSSSYEGNPRLCGYPLKGC